MDRVPPVYTFRKTRSNPNAEMFTRVSADDESTEKTARYTKWIFILLLLILLLITVLMCYFYKKGLPVKIVG